VKTHLQLIIIIKIIGLLATFLINGILQTKRKARPAVVKEPSGV
jgi:hypothetical protein